MYCKAGFQHTDLADCEHVVNQTPPKKGFQVPEDYYSEQALAARWEENRKRYGPVSRDRVHAIHRAVNEVRAMNDKEVF